jgi:hypothetical protein
MCREPNLTMVSYLPLVLDQGYHKSYHIFGSRGCKNKKLALTNAKARIPKNVYS